MLIVVVACRRSLSWCNRLETNFSTSYERTNACSIEKCQALRRLREGELSICALCVAFVCSVSKLNEHRENSNSEASQYCYFLSKPFDRPVVDIVASCRVDVDSFIHSFQCSISTRVPNSLQVYSRENEFLFILCKYNFFLSYFSSVVVALLLCSSAVYCWCCCHMSLLSIEVHLVFNGWDMSNVWINSTLINITQR